RSGQRMGGRGGGGHTGGELVGAAAAGFPPPPPPGERKRPKTAGGGGSPPRGGEPIGNRRYVDHVQITMAEDGGIGGRAGYYDGIGAARDVIQNHLMQLLALTAMEEPVSFDADSLRAEKEKVLSAIRCPRDLAPGTAIRHSP